MLQGSVGQRTSSKLASARGLQGMKGLQGKGSAKEFAEALTPQLGARTPSRAPWQEAENMGASFQALDRGQCTLCMWPTGVAGPPIVSPSGCKG